MASAKVKEFTSDNWQTEVVASTVPVVVDFWAAWCGPCRALAPTIDKVADKYDGKVKVGKLDVDQAQDLAVKYSVSTIPRILFFKGGDTPRQTIVGAVSETEISKVIDGLLQEK